MTWEQRKKKIERGLDRIGATGGAKKQSSRADNPFGVDDDFVNSFVNDTKKYYSDEVERYNSSGYGDTASNKKLYEGARDSLAPRVTKLKAYAVRNRDSLSSVQKKRIDDAISYYTNATNEIAGAYDTKIGELSKFTSEDEYKAAAKKSDDLQARRDKYNLSENPTVDEVEEILRELKVQRAKKGLLAGEDNDLDSDIEFFENYALRYGYGSSSDYDKVINRLKNEKSIYDDRLAASANDMLTDNIISQMDKRDALQKQIDTITAEKNAIKNGEKFWDSYASQRSSADYESKSIPISTAKNLSDYELNGEGYEKAEDGSWYKWGLGGVSYYEPYEDMLHEYINATPEEQERMFNEESITSTVGRGVSYADRVATSKYSTYGEMTDEEKQLYNYLYNTEGKDAAKAMLEKLKPTLDKRFQQNEAIRLEELAYKEPVFASLASIGTNVQSAMMAPAQLTASLVGKNDIWFDNSAMTTSSLRSGAGKRVGDLPLLDAELPVVGNAGEFLYGGLMSMADMGVAMGLGAGLGGSSNAAAKITQAIMSSSAASNEIYSAHERGITGPEAAVRGVVAGAAEWITEKYSVENLFSGKSHGIVLEALKQMGIEASEETASTLINKAADLIVSELAGHENEYEARVRELIEGGATRKEAEKAALTEFWRELGTDALSGALMGAVMGAGKGVAVKGSTKAEAKTAEAARQLAVEPIESKTPGVYNAVPGKDGTYAISRATEDGVSETVDLDTFNKNSPEYKIFRAAEDSHMTPAVATKLVNDYNETGDLNNYIAEAVYVSAAAKAGTSYEALSKGAGVLSEDVRRAIWDDGRIYSENKVKARQTFLNEIKTKASGNILAGKFNKTDIEGMKLNSAQQRAVDVADALSGLGFNIRMVKDINGNRKILGYYDKKTGDIVLSVNARAKDVNKVLKTQLLPTLSHEVTHSMKSTSPEIYAQYSEVVLGALYSKGELDGIVNREFNRLRDSGRYEEMSDSEIYDAAYDEIVARASEDMLADPKAIEKICRENRTVGEKILEAIDRFISTLKDILSGKWEKSVHLEAEILRDMQKEYETARDLWVKALADTAEARAALSEAGDVVREDGTPVATGFDSGEIQLNEATYEEEGRAVLGKYLNRQVKSKKLSRADADDILNNLDRIYDTMKTFAGKYAPYAAWAEAKVIRDGKGKPVFSVVTPNGDYSMNIDFSLVCKKRRMLDAVFNRMIERGLIDDFSLGKEEIVKINNIIKEHNFEIACALCFVDAKRFRQAGVADSFVEIYNGIVNEITPDGVEVPYFNFGGNKTLNTEGKGLDGVKVDNGVFQRYINEYGEKSVEGKVAKHLRDYPADRKLLHRGDFLSTAGFDAVKRQNPEILSLFNSKKGSGGPKSAFSDTQYLNEIIASRTFNAAKAFAVGGVRVQSFSDYIPRLVFDYCQMVGDLAAKRLPAHAYSKEDLFVKQFGKTGIKINMSLIPKIVDGGVAPGLDADGNYAWADESFDFETAKKIQNADGYTDNCGTICVGVSREHILKLLSDPEIRMVIPYHKSGLNPIVAQMNKIAEFKDYTNEQNTRYTNKDGTAGSKLSDEDVKSQPNVNALMQKGMTAKEAAQAYLDWCDQKGYTPKFDEFAGDENYYKLLIDFVCYNKNGDFVPQGAVKMNFPNAEDKFGSMAKLIESGLEADAVTQYRQNKELDPIVDEITEVLGSDLQFNEALDDEYMDAVNNGDMETAQRMVDDAAKQAGYDTDAWHGTNQGDFTVFEWDKTQRADGGFYGRGHYFTKFKNTAEHYGERVIKVKLRLGKTFVWENEVNSYQGKKPPNLNARNVVTRVNMAKLFPDLFFNKKMYYGEYDSKTGDYVEKSINWGELENVVNRISDGLTLRAYQGGTYRWATDGQFWEVPVGEVYSSEKEANEGRFFAAIDALSEKYSGILNSMTFDDQTTYTQAYASEITEELKSMGYDSAMDTPEGGEIVVFDSSQIKSADPITYDDNGNVIPLSERFNTDNPDIRYNEALDDELTMREVLTGALEGAALTEADAKVLERYRRRVKELDGYDERLREINREIKELSFGKGKRDTARLSELKSEKAAVLQDLRRADRKLLELSSTEALKNLFDREAKRLRREKSEALRAASKEARRMSEAQLKEAVEKERERGAAAKAGERMAAEAEIAEIRRRAAERELKDRTRRERLDVEKRIRSVISYVTRQTDDKNVKQGLRGVVADFAHAILSNNAAYTQSEMTRMRERYEEIAKAGEGVEFIHKGAYDFDIFEELKNLEGALKGRAWRDLTTSELGTVDRVTRNVMHMIRLENRIFRNGKGESRVKIGEACERAIAECVSRRKEKTTPKGKVGQAVQRFGDEVDRLIVTGNLMPVYYFDILGGEFEELYNDLVDGQNKWSRIVEDSARKADEIKEKYDFDKLTKGETVFTTDEGVSFEMTVREAMYFYAAFKRETLRGDTSHYLKGGIASDKIVAKAKGDDVKRYRSGTVRLSGDDVAMILDSLSTEQKAFADELVAYLSTDIARYGNETSMDLYGIEKFGDEYYIPYRVSGDARYMDPIEAAEPDKGKGGGEAKIKHTGMTNAIKHGAGNAMEQADIMEVFTKHCVEMANYAAFAVPIENIGGVLNFRGADGELLRAEMRQKLGDNMTSYFDTFIRDMNGGVKTTASGIEKFLSLQKKASVAASLSTVVQQPTAMFRAMVMIDPKYFVTVKGGETMQGIRASWDEMKQYAPGVTVVKDMGKFDVGSGVSAAEYISGDMTFGKAVDKAAGFAAEWADKLTWIHIWKACKAEAKAKGLRGEELLTSAGKRFTDVINRTQVYDSTLVRSENMRSRNALMKPFTAFKAEPTVTLNVMADAVRSKSPAKIAITASALLVSTIVNNALRALVYAGRDDDEEKGYLEKYGVEFSEGLAEDMMLWNYVPFVSDLASITRGFKSKRMETQLFESVYNSFNALWEEDAGWREWATFVGDVGNFAGLPVKNVIRDFVMMPMNIANSSDNSVRGAWYAAVDAIANSTTGKNLEKIGISITNTDYDGYIEALESGDVAEAEKIFGEIIEYKMFKALRKAEAKGEEFYEDEARKNAESSVRGKVTEHLDGSYNGYLKALDSGDTKGAAKLYGDITELLVSYERVRCESRGKRFDEKKALASAESSLQSRVTKHFKKRYVAADYDERTEIRQILRSTGLYENVRNTTKAWVKSAEEEDE